MATNTKKIVNVEILTLDETGYGPQGKHTRRQWRAECLENLLAGKAQFLSWQASLQIEVGVSYMQANFGISVHYYDGTHAQIDKFFSSQTLDFSGVSFSDWMGCRDYRFTQDALFNGAYFDGDAVFDFAEFDGCAEFAFVQFHGVANFCSVKFDRKAIFSDAQFYGYAEFENTSFVENTEFNGAEFGGNALFNRINVDGNADFFRTSFSFDAEFDAANFSGDVDFSDCSFEGTVIFNRVKFANRSYFVETIFKEFSHFENAEFKRVGHFERARFGEIPNFLGVDIASTSLQLPDDLHFTQDAYDEDSINQISSLKRLADEYGQWEQALNFNAMELRAKRKLFCQKLKPESHPDAKLLNSHLSWRVWIRFSNFFRGNFWFCVFTWFYEKAADFGRSFTRPLFWLVVLMVTSLTFALVAAIETDPCQAENNCAPIFAQLATAPKHKDSENKPMLALSAYRAAAEYGIFRFANFADFTDKDKNTEAVAMRLFNQPIEPWWARLFDLFKELAGTVLLFLVGLGLRNRYRVG